jgi:hypothetical protein
MTETDSSFANAAEEKSAQLAMLNRGVMGVARKQQPLSQIASEPHLTRRNKSQLFDNKENIRKLEALLQGYNSPAIKGFMEEISSRFREFETERRITDDELAELPSDVQDFILAMAERIQHIRNIEQAPADTLTSDIAGSDTPPLPTAENVPETWKERDKTIYVIDEEGNERPETPLDFFLRVYAPWIRKVTRRDIRHIDSSLYTALDNWRRRDPINNIIPDAILPKAYRDLSKVQLTEEEIKIYNKVNSLKSSASQKRNSA